MSVSTVECLVENLQQLMLYNFQLFSDAKEQVEKLEKELSPLRNLLEDFPEKRIEKDENLQELVRQISDVVYKVEDIINVVYTTQAEKRKSKNYFQTPIKLVSIAKYVDLVCTKVRDTYRDLRGEAQGLKTPIKPLSIAKYVDFACGKIGDTYRELREPRVMSKAPPVRGKNIVGFEDEAEKLIGYLTEKTQQLDVISIIGMPGLGKTTLAGKIFRDPEIKDEFPTRIWVYVSKMFTKKDIFLSILRWDMRPTEDDMHGRSAEELAQLISAYLEERRFLIVMDDVWTAEDWDKLQIILPKSSKMGKVLITSQHEEVALHANPSSRPHKLRLLTSDESWLLLQLEVFGKPECPPELEILGKEVARQCDGVPFAIVVIGGILANKISASNEMSVQKREWKQVARNMSKYLNKKPERRMENMILYNYYELPYHLRMCFLYLGMFPGDFSISARKVIRMWIAEGFIQQKVGLTLEETAENYLKDLVEKNLIVIYNISFDGRVKEFGVHEKLRSFCKEEAENERENFFREMKWSSSGEEFEPPVSDVPKFSRLCVHSNVCNFLSSKPYGPHIRSFLCFTKEDITLPAENISDIPAAFKLLRVLDIMPLKFSEIPRNLYQLVHLRYIVMSIYLRVLPAAFSKLWNLQTLIVHTSSRTLEIKADIWKMFQLSYFRTNAIATLPGTGKDNREGEELHTLGTISPKNCTKEVFERACNLKKLGICGRLALLLDGKNGSFDSFRKLGKLEKLKLVNDVFPLAPSEGPLGGLPPPYKFPPKLRQLTLSRTFLDWIHMSILGLLENLEVLKLKDNAFMGECWEVTDGSFLHLKFLLIGGTNLVRWVVSGHHFPRLRCLKLSNCEDLEQVPIGFAVLPSLQVLDLHHCTRSAVASAKKIREAKQKREREQTAEVNRFRLSYYPPDKD